MRRWFDDLDVQRFQVGKKEFSSYEKAEAHAIKKASKKAMKNGEHTVQISCWTSEDGGEPQWYHASEITVEVVVAIDGEQQY